MLLMLHAASLLPGFFVGSFGAVGEHVMTLRLILIRLDGGVSTRNQSSLSTSGALTLRETPLEYLLLHVLLRLLHLLMLLGGDCQVYSITKSYV